MTKIVRVFLYLCERALKFRVHFRQYLQQKRFVSFCFHQYLKIGSGQFLRRGFQFITNNHPVAGLCITRENNVKCSPLPPD